MTADEIGTSILMDGIWEKYETELFEGIVQEGMTIVDIGAHYKPKKLVGVGIKEFCRKRKQNQTFNLLLEKG